MKAYDNGCFFSCRVSAPEITEFNLAWPGSSLDDSASIWFQFDKRNGDLVDMKPDDMDGPEVLALSHDAQNFAAKELNLPECCYRNPIKSRP
jgi:hypothetical protein